MTTVGIRAIALSLLTLVDGIPTSLKAAPSCCVDITVDVQPRIGMAGAVMLHVTLTNPGHDPLQFTRSFLPWTSRLPIILSAAQERWPHDVLGRNPIIVIKDPGPGIVSIAPGESINGDIRLADEFDHFAETLEKENIVVLWSYQLTTVDNRVSKWIGGSIEISAGEKKASTR
jgi:hypothetical protein